MNDEYITLPRKLIVKLVNDIIEEYSDYVEDVDIKKEIDFLIKENPNTVRTSGELGGAY